MFLYPKEPLQYPWSFSQRSPLINIIHRYDGFDNYSYCKPQLCFRPYPWPCSRRICKNWHRELIYDRMCSISLLTLAEDSHPQMFQWDCRNVCRIFFSFLVVRITSSIKSFILHSTYSLLSFIIRFWCVTTRWCPLLHRLIKQLLYNFQYRLLLSHSPFWVRDR